MSRYFNEGFDAMNDPSYLEHHGVLGMKWGVRKQRPTLAKRLKDRYERNVKYLSDVEKTKASYAHIKKTKNGKKLIGTTWFKRDQQVSANGMGAVDVIWSPKRMTDGGKITQSVITNLDKQVSKIGKQPAGVINIDLIDNTVKWAIPKHWNGHPILAGPTSQTYISDMNPNTFQLSNTRKYNDN
jgi:hypothetical protein